MKPGYMFLLLMILAACKKEKLDQGEQLTHISFQNASTELTDMLLSAAPMQHATILLDSPVVYTPDETLRDKGVQLPYFNRGFSDAVFYNLYFYPNVGYNTIQPWITYMRMPAGVHTTGVTDTANKKLTYTTLQWQPEKHYSVFFTDSAGIYDIVQAEDEQLEVSGKIRIRLAHMSPSNDTVCVSAGKDSLLAFQEGIHFKQVTPYHHFLLDSNALLTIRVYKKSDPSVIVSRTFIDAVPGRSYTVIFRGYTQAVTYIDRFKSTRHFERNADLFIERMY